MDRELEQTLALAAIAQCAFLVRQLAHHGVVAADKFGTAVDSLFVTRPHSSEEVFGSVKNLNLGLQALQEILEGNSALFSPDQVLRYITGMLYLESQLARRPDLLERIGSDIERLDLCHPARPRAENQALVRDLARLYQDTLSTLPFRIQVKGDMQRLQNEYLAARIRVLLFAGIRAAVLWKQRGGRRWHLLFLRSRIKRDINRLLHKLP
ncbi:MAG: high frequency lysogenization protein HflD [Pseudohongiellaceae bacterium]